MTFKSIWQWLRVFLFIGIFLAMAASILPCVFLVGQGDLALLYIYLGVFAAGFAIQEAERRVGWVDDRYDWKE